MRLLQTSPQSRSLVANVSIFFTLREQSVFTEDGNDFANLDTTHRWTERQKDCITSAMKLGWSSIVYDISN